MQRTVKSNKSGFTVIEVLVALVILAIAMLAILDVMAIAIQHNLEIYARNESVRIAEQAMNELRNTSFAALGNANYNVTRRYKQFTKTFNVSRTITAISTNSCSIRLQITWRDVNDRPHTHTITSLISRDT